MSSEQISFRYPACTPSLGPFLTDISCSSPAGHADVLLLQARYHLALYSDALFMTYQLPFPAHLGKAVAKRRAEYLASRVCARYALTLFGFTDFVLANDADRAPVWPQGMAGSLSHTRQRIGLLLTREASGKLLGVDCEEFMQPETAEEMQSMVISAREKAVLATSHQPFATALTAAFSLKESLYKTLFPAFRQFMNFNEAEITACDSAITNVTLRLNRTLSADFPAGRLFSGRVEHESDSLTSWIITPRIKKPD